MEGEVTVPKGKPTIVIFLSCHAVKLPSKYLHLHIEICAALCLGQIIFLQ